MKIGDVALAAAGLGLALAAGACAWLLATWAQGLTVGSLYLNIDILAKLLLVTVTLMYLPIAGLSAAALLTGRGHFGVPLALLAAISAALGLLAAGWVLFNVQRALAAVGPVSFGAVAPQYAEAALAAAMGLFGATLALAARRLGDHRR